MQLKSQDAEADLFMPIKAINTFNMDWRIKARVVKKGAMRTYNNAKGPGKLFNIDLVDRDNTQIQATFFNDSADRFFDRLQEQKVYVFANG